MEEISNQIEVRPINQIDVTLDKQIELAKKYPRNEPQILNSVLAELDLVPEFASKSYYSIPYKNDQGGTTYIEGPSIRTAMTLARSWGNCDNGARIAEERDDRIIVEGIFKDLETGLRTVRQYSVSRGYWSKQLKRIVPLREDRLNMAIQSGMSKAVRNAILSSLPIWLIESYMKKVKNIVSSSDKNTPKNSIKNPKDRIGAAKEKFIKLGISEQQFDTYVSNSSLDLNSLIFHLTGLYNSISDGSQTIENIFGEEKKESIEEKGQIKEKDLFK